MIYGNISVRFLAEKLYRDLGVNTELPFEDVVEWSAEALTFIGAFDQFQSKVTLVNIENHKGKLPCGFYKLQLIAYNDRPIKYAGNSLINNAFCDDCSITSVSSTTNTTLLSEESFYINDYYIFTSFETGDICLTYLSIPVDEEGYPTIPDDPYYMKACASYVTKMIDYQEWRKGRVPDKVFQKSEADWDWYCAAARGSSNSPDMSRMEQLKNTIVRLIPEQTRYDSFMRNTRETRKLH